MATGPAPRIQLGDATLDHRPIRPEVLADSRQTELVKPAERREIWGSKGSLMHVEVFQMGSVGTSIIGRPRRLPSHRHAALIHTLNCEEPLMLMFGVAVAVISGAGAMVAFSGNADMVGWFAGTVLVPAGLAATMMFTAWAPYVPVRLALAVSGKLPFRLDTFLSDAHRWEVLRQFGARYQFRHDALLRHLKSRYEAGRSQGAGNNAAAHTSIRNLSDQGEHSPAQSSTEE